MRFQGNETAFHIFFGNGEASVVYTNRRKMGRFGTFQIPSFQGNVDSKDEVLTYLEKALTDMLKSIENEKAGLNAKA